MTSVKWLVLLVGLIVLGGCCFPMQSYHNLRPRHHAGGPGAAQPGGDETNAPQEYIMQEQPPAAPAQSIGQAPK